LDTDIFGMMLTLNFAPVTPV